MYWPTVYTGYNVWYVLRRPANRGSTESKHRPAAQSYSRAFSAENWVTSQPFDVGPCDLDRSVQNHEGHLPPVPGGPGGPTPITLSVEESLITTPL